MMPPADSRLCLEDEMSDEKKRDNPNGNKRQSDLDRDLHREQRDQKERSDQARDNQKHG
jgi:hypothetical protein